MQSQEFVKSFKQSFKAYNAPQQQQSSISEVLDKIKVAVNSRRIMIRPMFQDFDPYNHGRIQTIHFFQCLDKIVPLTTQDHKVLSDRYLDKESNEIAYVQLIADVDPKDFEMLDFGKSHKYPKITHLGKGEQEHEATLANINLQLTKKAIRLRDFFYDYDPMRKGFIAEGKFITAISTSNLELSMPELRTLINHYRYEDDTITKQVHYLALLKDLKRTFAVTNFAKNSLLTCTLNSGRSK